MNLLYDTLIDLMERRFINVKKVTAGNSGDLDDYRQLSMIVRSKRAFAITAEIFPGPADWVTIIKYFSPVHGKGIDHIRINDNLSDDALRFAWNDAKTFVITRIDESGLFSFSLLEQPFVIASFEMLPRNDVIDKLMSLALESTYGHDC